MKLLILKSMLVLFVALSFASGAPIAQSQKPMKVDELVSRQKSLDRKAVTLTGIFVSGHVGAFVKDDKEKFAVRVHFEPTPKWAGRYVQQKDELYRKLEDAAAMSLSNSPRKYSVELICLVSVLHEKTYDVYAESPLQIYPLRVLRVDPM